MKRALVVATVVAVLALGVVGLDFILIPQQTGSQTQTSSTGASSSGSQTQTTSKTSTSSSTGASSSGGYALLMSVDPSSRLIPLGGISNFTLTLHNLGNLSGNFSISGVAPSGLSLSVKPTSVAMSGSGAAADLRVSSSSSVSPGTYPVTIQARSSAAGVFNQTFNFEVVQYLVQIIHSQSNVRVSLTVRVGSTVTWIALDIGGCDESCVYHTVTFTNIGASSGPLPQFQTWSYTFNDPGTYQYHDAGAREISGEIIVTS